MQLKVNTASFISLSKNALNVNQNQIKKTVIIYMPQS